MAGLGRSERLLTRLERDVSRAVAGHDRVVLAFSGGLGSLVVGSVARKRTDVQCVVVGVRDGPDRVAATLAVMYLDLRVQVLPITARRALPVARRMADAHSDLSVAETLAFVPLRMVMDSQPAAEVLAGFTPDRLGPAARRSIKTALLRLPLLDVAGPTPLERADLLGIGHLLGIPEAFLRVRARSPAVGSGLEPALRALAREERTTIAELIRPRALRRRA